MPIRLHAVYAGRGDAMLIEDGDKLYLLDAGPQGFTHRERSGAPYWRYYASACKSVSAAMQRPANEIAPDAVIVSHAHEDHYGGFNAIFRKFMSAAWTEDPTTAHPFVFNGPLVTQRPDPQDVGEGSLRSLLTDFGLDPSGPQGDSVFAAFTFDERVDAVYRREEQKARAGRTWSVDTSEDNLASVLMFHKASRMVFTGDSAGYLVLPFVVDCLGRRPKELSIFKVPHHGSLRNSQRGEELAVVEPFAWRQYELLCILVGARNWDAIGMPEALRDPGAVAVALKTVQKACKLHGVVPATLRDALRTAFNQTIANIVAGQRNPFVAVDDDLKATEIWRAAHTTLAQQDLLGRMGATPRKTKANAPPRGVKRGRDEDLPELSRSWFGKLTPQRLADVFNGNLALTELKAFFATFEAANYVVSADYTYKHPSVETVAAIAAAGIKRGRQVRLLVTDGDAIDFSGIATIVPNWDTGLEIRYLKPPAARMVLDVTDPALAHDIGKLDPEKTTAKLVPQLDMSAIHAQFRNNHGARIPDRTLLDDSYRLSTAGNLYLNLADDGAISVTAAQQEFYVDEAWTLSFTVPARIKEPNGFDVIRLRGADPNAMVPPERVFRLVAADDDAHRGQYALELPRVDFREARPEYVSASAQEKYRTRNLAAAALFTLTRVPPARRVRELRAADSRAALPLAGTTEVSLQAFCTTVGVPAGAVTPVQLLPELIGIRGSDALVPEFKVPVLTRVLGWNADFATSTVTYVVDEFGPDVTAATLRIQLGSPLTFLLDGQTETIASADSTLALSADEATLTMTVGVTTTTGIDVRQTVRIPKPSRSRPLDQYLHDVGMDPAQWADLTVGTLLTAFVGAEANAAELVMRCPSFIAAEGIAEWLIDHDASEVETQFTTTGTVEVVSARIVAQTPAGISQQIEGLTVEVPAVTLVVTDARLPTMDVRLEAAAKIGSVKLTGTSVLSEGGAELDLAMEPGTGLSDLVSLLGVPALPTCGLPFDAGVLGAVSLTDPGVVIRQPSLGAEPYEVVEAYGTISFTGWKDMLPAGFPAPARSSLTARVLSPLDPEGLQVAVEIDFEFDIADGKTLTAMFAAEPLPEEPPAWAYTLSVYSDPTTEPCSLAEIVAVPALGVLDGASTALPIISDALAHIALDQLTLTLEVPDTGSASIALADIGLVMFEGWELLPSVMAGPAQLDLHWDGDEWSGSASARAVFDGTYPVAAELLLPTVTQPGVISFHNASDELTFSAFARICRLGDLSTVPVVGTVLDIAITDVELVLGYPQPAQTLELIMGGVSVCAGPRILGPLNLTSLGFEIEHYQYDLGVVPAGTTTFLLEANWGDSLVATVGYDGVTAELSAGLRTIGDETIGDLLGRLFGSTHVPNVLLPIIKDFVVRDASAVLATDSYDLESFAIRLDTSASLTFLGTTIEEISVSYARDPFAYHLSGRLTAADVSGPGTDATITIDCSGADGQQTVTASIAPTPDRTGLTASGLLRLLGLPDPKPPVPEGAPKFFDLGIKVATATFTVSPFALTELSVDVVSEGTLPILDAPKIEVTGLALHVDYDKSVEPPNPTTTGYVYGQVRIVDALVTVMYRVDDTGQPEFHAAGELVTGPTPDFATLIGSGAYYPGYGLPTNLDLPDTIPMARVTIVAQPDKFIDVAGYGQATWDAAINQLDLHVASFGGRVRVAAGAQPGDPATYATWLYGELAFNAFAASALLSFGSHQDTVLSAKMSDAGPVQIPQIASALGAPWNDLVPADTAVTPAFSAAAHVYVNFTTDAFALYGQLQALGTAALLSVVPAGKPRNWVFVFGLAPEFKFAGIWPPLGRVDDYLALTAANVSVLDYDGTVADLETDIDTVAAVAKQQQVEFKAPFEDLLPALRAEVDEDTLLHHGWSFFAELDLTKGLLGDALGKISEGGVPTQILLWGTVDKTEPVNTAFSAEIKHLVLLGGFLTVDGTATYRPNAPESFAVDADIAVKLTEAGEPYVFHGLLTVGKTETYFALTGDQQPREIPTPFGKMVGVTLTAPRLEATYQYPDEGTTSTVKISGAVTLTIGGHPVPSLHGFVYFLNGVPEVAAVEFGDMSITDVFANQLTTGSFPTGYTPFELRGGSLYYSAAGARIDERDYLPGYHISALVTFFGFPITVDVAIESGGILLSAAYVGELDFVFVQLTGYKDADGHAHPGPTVTVDTRLANKTIYQLGCGISVFKQPLLITTFDYEYGSDDRFRCEATYDGTFVGIDHPKLAFTYSDSDGLQLEDWPLAPVLGEALEWAKLLQAASKDSSGCGELVGLVFDKAIDTDFNLNLHQEGAPTADGLPVQLTGTYTVKVLGAELFTLAMPTIEGSIPYPASFEFEGLVDWVADTIVTNAEAIAKSLLNDMVGDQKALKILIAHFAINYASQELLTSLICRDSDPDNVRDQAREDVDESEQEVSEKQGEVSTATSTAMTAMSLSAAADAFATALIALGALGAFIVGLIRLIDVAWSFLTDDERAEKERARQAQERAQRDVDDARARIEGLIAMEGEPGVAFPSDTTVEVSWDAANLPHQPGIDYGGYQGFTYAVEIATDPGFGTVVARGETATTSFQATDSVFGRTNTVYGRVRAHYRDFVGAPITGSGSHTLALPAPATVTQSLGRDWVDVEIAAVADANGYLVQLVDSAHGDVVGALQYVEQPGEPRPVVACRFEGGAVGPGVGAGALLLARAQAVGDPHLWRDSGFTTAPAASAIATVGPPANVVLEIGTDALVGSWDPIGPGTYAVRVVDDSGFPLDPQPPVAISGSTCTVDPAGFEDGRTIGIEVRPVAPGAIGLLSLPARVVVQIMPTPTWHRTLYFAWSPSLQLIWQPLGVPGITYQASVTGPGGQPLSPPPDIELSPDAAMVTGAAIAAGHTYEAKVRVAAPGYLPAWSQPDTIVAVDVPRPASVTMTFADGALRATWSPVVPVTLYLVDLVFQNYPVAHVEPETNSAEFGPGTGVPLVPGGTYAVFVSALDEHSLGEMTIADATVPTLLELALELQRGHARVQRAADAIVALAPTVGPAQLTFTLVAAGYTRRPEVRRAVLQARRGTTPAQMGAILAALDDEPQLIDLLLGEAVAGPIIVALAALIFRPAPVGLAIDLKRSTVPEAGLAPAFETAFSLPAGAGAALLAAVYDEPVKLGGVLHAAGYGPGDAVAGLRRAYPALVLVEAMISLKTGGYDLAAPDVATALRAAFSPTDQEWGSAVAATTVDATGMLVAGLLHAAAVDRATATTFVAACWPVLSPQQVAAVITAAYGPPAEPRTSIRGRDERGGRVLARGEQGEQL